jgi:hypothetical protein
MKNLTIHKISVFLTILNATQIARSLGQLKSFKNNKEYFKKYKVYLFNEIDELIGKMKRKTLTYDNIYDSIYRCSEKFKISIGQSQKAINVFLKFYFYFYETKKEKIKKCLHCPLDSRILSELKKRKKIKDVKKLNKIDKNYYNDIQNKIGEICIYKIDFDTEWDKQLLERHFTKSFYQQILKY